VTKGATAVLLQPKTAVVTEYRTANTVHAYSHSNTLIAFYVGLAINA